MQDHDSVPFPPEVDLFGLASSSNPFDFSFAGVPTNTQQQFQPLFATGADFDQFASLADSGFDMASLFTPSSSTASNTLPEYKSSIIAPPGATNSNFTTGVRTMEYPLMPESASSSMAVTDLVETARQTEEQIIEFPTDQVFGGGEREPIVSQVPTIGNMTQQTYDDGLSDFLVDMDQFDDELHEVDVDGSSEYTTSSSSLASSPAPSVVPTVGRSRKSPSNKVPTAGDSGIKKKKRTRKTVKQKKEEGEQRLQGLITRGVELRQTLCDTRRQLEILKPLILTLINKRN